MIFRKRFPFIVITAFVTIVLTVVGYQRITSLQADRQPPAVEQTIVTESLQTDPVEAEKNKEDAGDEKPSLKKRFFEVLKGIRAEK